MIADTAILSTSPWQADQILATDAQIPSPQFDSPIFDMDYISLGVEIEKMKTDSVKMTSSIAGSSMSAGTSIASSECSDEAFVEYDGDSDSLFAVSEDQEYLSLCNMLDVNTIPESFPFDWSDGDLNVQGDSLLTSPSEENEVHQEQIPSTRSSPQPSRKRTHSQTLTAHKPWSKMSHTEQMTTIQELSDVISHKMGLREQLEVIRIMNPQANVMRTDTEFVIDLDSLSDEKLARVREFVRQHTSRNESSSNVSSSSHRNCQAQSTQHTKQLTKKQRKLQEKEERQRQRKEYRQMMKEKKSGLFMREQVLSLAFGDKDDVDDDIDILT